jgi:hypothetical protein
MLKANTELLPRRARWPRILLFVVVAGGTALGTMLAFRQGLVMPALNPLPPIDLAQPAGWLIDWRLASMKHHPELCALALKAPHIEAQQIPDSPLKDGCGWSNGVRMAAAGGVRAAFDKVTCETAVALALWLEQEVQPAARQILGQPVRSIQSYGSYACRNIVGSKYWGGVRSQHAIANAVDIAGFTLADGRSISVRAQWREETEVGRFLRTVHRRACPYFRVVLGPDYNAAHYDHFHLDRGPLSRCR